MIKLAYAIAFLAVFGVVAYAVILLLTDYFKKKENNQQNNNKSTKQKTKQK